jgi:hemerythrin
MAGVPPCARRAGSDSRELSAYSKRNVQEAPVETIIWDSSFSVGIPAIDKQHKKLIGMLNTMAEAHEALVNSEVVSEILDEMTRYAAEHFRSEEELMRQHGFPYLDEHKNKHLSFRKDVARFCVDATAHEASVPENVLSFLKDWLVDHILYCDQRYAEFFRQIGVA